jgi:hypothetical protein
VRGHRTLRCARLVEGVAGWRELILVDGDSPACQDGGCSSAEGGSIRVLMMLINSTTNKLHIDAD